MTCARMDGTGCTQFLLGIYYSTKEHASYLFSGCPRMGYWWVKGYQSRYAAAGMVQPWWTLPQSVKVCVSGAHGDPLTGPLPVWFQYEDDHNPKERTVPFLCSNDASGLSASLLKWHIPVKNPIRVKQGVDVIASRKLELKDQIVTIS